MSSNFQISLGAAASGGGGAWPINNVPITIAQDLAELIAQNADVFQRTGAKVINLDAGMISMAYSGQVGRVINGMTVTAAMVQANKEFLKYFGQYCRDRGITINVEAGLTLPPQKDWIYQVIGPAVEANLPITAFENDAEIGISVPEPENYAMTAANMVSIVRQIVKYFPNAKIGQWEAGTDVTASTDWWAAYDNAAQAAGLPQISYLVADTGWNAPWDSSSTTWTNWLQSLSSAAQSRGMQLKVLVDGIAADATDKEWTAQSEQHAAMLAQIGIPVDTILVRTWQQACPESMAPVNDPTTLGNTAAEIGAIYPLYAQDAVTAKGKIRIASDPQIIVATDRPTPLPFVALSCVNTNSSAGDRLALVMIAGAGCLSASPAGSGTVGGSGTGTLVLNGTMQDLATILRTLSITEPSDGPDTIDIEAFGINGRLDDIQIAVVAVPGGHQGAGATYEFVPTVAGQEWVSATASVSASGVVSSTMFLWNTTDRDPATDEYLSTQTIAIYEPLAQGCIADGRGGAMQPCANPSANGISLPLNRTLRNPKAYNPAVHVSTLDVIGTTYAYAQQPGN